MTRVVVNRRVEDFELHKELYRGKTSLLYMATDRISGMQVALKLYRKRKLSILNRCVPVGNAYALYFWIHTT